MKNDLKLISIHKTHNFVINDRIRKLFELNKGNNAQTSASISVVDCVLHSMLACACIHVWFMYKILYDGFGTFCTLFMMRFTFDSVCTEFRVKCSAVCLYLWFIQYIEYWFHGRLHWRFVSNGKNIAFLPRKMINLFQSTLILSIERRLM